MTLPTSGTISLTDIQTEFGGTNPIRLNEYYKGGAYVTNTDYAPNVPTSGPISLSDFYGAANTTLYTYTYTSDTTITLPATFRSPLIVTALGGGGGSGFGPPGIGGGSPGLPNQNNPGTNGAIYGGPGQDKGGDGGGGGGGGAGSNGGVGGNTVGGDSGAYSGENGNSLVPAGGLVSTGSNGGPSSTLPGTGGSITISYYAQ